jgi:hypothetical protein
MYKAELFITRNTCLIVLAVPTQFSLYISGNHFETFSTYINEILINQFCNNIGMS